MINKYEIEQAKKAKLEYENERKMKTILLVMFIVLFLVSNLIYFNDEIKTYIKSNVSDETIREYKDKNKMNVMNDLELKKIELELKKIKEVRNGN